MTRSRSAKEVIYVFHGAGESVLENWQLLMAAGLVEGCDILGMKEAGVLLCESSGLQPV